MDSFSCNTSDAHFKSIYVKTPLPPNLIPSRISIPPSPPMKLGEKKEHASPNSVAFLDNDSPAGGSKMMKVMGRKPPLYPRPMARCVSPTDLRLRTDSPSLQMKRNYMRRFLSEIAEEDL